VKLGVEPETAADEVAFCTQSENRPKAHEIEADIASAI
jgi:hypothetical protein